MSIGLTYRKYAIVAALLFVVSVLFIGQNYLKFSHNTGYDLLKSFSFNLLAVGGFALTVPIIRRIARLISNYRKWTGFGLHLLLILALITSYAILSSLVLYGLGFLSKPLHDGFFLKYLSNISIVHLLAYLFIYKLFSSEALSKEVFIEVLLGKNRVTIKSDDILYVQSFDHYVKISTFDHVYLKKISMSEVLRILKKAPFIRVHRSYIINKNKIKSVMRNSGIYNVEINNGHKVRIGKTYLSNLKSDPSFTYL